MKQLGLLILILLVGLVFALTPGLPQGLDGYPNWVRFNLNRVTDNPTGVHPQSKDIYISTDPSEYMNSEGRLSSALPDGTIIVKERNDVEQLLVDRVYVMEKVAGEWAYSFYDRQADSSFTEQTPPSDTFCMSCHQGAAEHDFVYTEFYLR
jgi:hypothetical protein